MVNQIYNADCLDILKDISDESVDLVVTDCPYKVVAGGCTGDRAHGGIFSNNIDGFRSGGIFEHNDIDFSEWLPAIYRVLKQGTHCYIMINGRNLKELQLEAEKVGFHFQNLLVWDKGNKTPNRFYMQQIEFILLLSKKPARSINDMGISNLFSIANPVGKKDHPTEKPVELMKIFVANSSNVGDVVLDPFMGTGGTILAAKELNRKYIGIEIDKEYFNIAENRLKRERKSLW